MLMRDMIEGVVIVIEQNKKNSNKRAIMVVIVFISLIVSFFVVSISKTSKYSTHKYEIYGNFSDLQILEPFVIDDIDADKFLKEKNPIYSFCNKVKWNDNDYTVYAYSFEDVNSCKEYVKDRTRHNPRTDKGYFMYGNVFFSTEYVVFNQNNMLFVQGKSIDEMYAFLGFLNETFDVVI